MRRPLAVSLGAVVLLAVASLLAAPFWIVDHAVRARLWLAGVQGHYVTIAGQPIHYLEAAPARDAVGAGKTLVLIHGLGAKAEDWAPLLPGLARQGYHVYAIDLLGYGRSAKPAGASYSIAGEERVVLNFMQRLGLRHADVGGWSMGGWVAMRLALDEPERVDRLVLYDSAGIYFPLEMPRTLFAPQTTAEFRALVARLTPKPVPWFLAADGLRRARRSRPVIQSTVDSMLSGADLLDFRLLALRRPTLIVWGADDHLIPLETGESLHRAIAGSEFKVLAGCGHLAPAECAQPALAATLDFLKRGSGASESAGLDTPGSSKPRP